MKSNQNLRKAAGAKEKSFKPIKTLDEIRTNKGGNGQNPSSQPETKIIGGNDADYGEYEYYVQLFYGTTSITCGGSLVAPNVVLTAAHCFSEELQYVSVGSYELALTYGDESGYAEHASIIDVAIHPLYDPENSLDHDIMVLKLDESFAQFKTLSLNFDDTLPAVGDSVTVIGLGVTNPEDDGSVATVLQELTLQTVPTDECFPSGSSFNDLVNGATEFCASSPGKAGGQDSCQGDSGGPIFSIDSSGEHVQMGVVSWGGSPCAAPGESGVYSRISTSRDFILSAICDQFASDASFCGQYNDGGNTGGGTGTGDEDDNENSDNSGKDDCGGTTSDGGASGLTSCSSTETYLLFEIKVDSFGSEVSWDLVDDSGSEIYSDSGFADGEMRSYEGCLSRVNSACYYLSIYDSYGDGMGYPYDGESAYIGVVFGQSSYLDNPTYTSQFTHELCHESA